MVDLEQKTNWHALPVKDVFKKLESGPKGLSVEGVERRREVYGFNELDEGKGLTPLKIFFYQFKNVMVFMLLAAALISFFINEFVDAVVIVVILVINIILGFIQEFKAEKAMEALQSLAAPKAVVVRDGEELVVRGRELVPGDVVVFSVGDIIPANIRLIEAVNLKMDQAHLTGESVPISKSVEPVPLNAILADRSSMAFMGSVVSSGRGLGVVTEIGMQTEIGHIALTVTSEEREVTPLQQEIDMLGKWLAIFALVAVSVVFVVGLLYQFSFVEILLTSVSLAVSAVPEGLPAVITITLALGMQRMAGKQAIVRKLSAVQTLGSVTIICSDKTGTLTKNEMTLTSVFDGFNDYEITGSGYEPVGDFLLKGKKINPLKRGNLKLLLEASVFCNNAYYGGGSGEHRVVGDPTEGCLLVAAAKAGLSYEGIKASGEELAEFSFSSERKRMSVVYDLGGERMAFAKGAPDVMLDLCNRILVNGRVKRLTKSMKQAILQRNSAMASNALRVLAVAYKPVSGKLSEKRVEQDLIFLGLTGMIDPPREEVVKAIELTRKAGIRVMVITGDHELTAKAIGQQVGLFSKSDVALTGAELERLSVADFKKAVRTVTIFARVSPEHKLRIVDELKAQGEIVAVTGDGVNDAPALKSAHIGVAMGIKGTDVSKGAAEMVLADDNFSTIVNAVEEGRNIFSNIKKFVKFLLSANADTIIEVLTAMMIGLPLPFLPIHILWMNLITDGVPALALSVDPGDKGVMSKKPRDPKKSLIGEVMIFILVAGLVDAIASISLYIIALNYEGYFLTGSAYALSKARTMAVSSAIIYELFFVFNCRDDEHSVFAHSFRENFLSNKKLTLAVLISLILQLMVIYFPPFQLIFNTTALSFVELGLVFLFASLGLLILPQWFHKEVTLDFLKRKH